MNENKKKNLLAKLYSTPIEHSAYGLIYNDMNMQTFRNDIVVITVMLSARVIHLRGQINSGIALLLSNRSLTTIDYIWKEFCSFILYLLLIYFFNPYYLSEQMKSEISNDFILRCYVNVYTIIDIRTQIKRFWYIL
jgi:hypothetical protein